jgi:thioredoxin 1
MVEVTDETFAAEVLEAGRPVVVDFWAPWCGPCKAVGKALEELEAEHGERVGFAMVNIDDNPLNAAEYGVLSLPTVILFEGGTARETVVGSRSRSYFERSFAPWLYAG